MSAMDRITQFLDGNYRRQVSGFTEKKLEPHPDSVAGHMLAMANKPISVDWRDGLGVVRRFGLLIGTAKADENDLYQILIEYQGKSFAQRHLSFKQLTSVPSAFCDLIDKRQAAAE